MKRKALSMVLFVTLTLVGLLGLVSVGYAQEPSGQSNAVFVKNGNVGIGTDSPGATLDVKAHTQWGKRGWYEAIRLSQNASSAIYHPGGGLLFGLNGDRRFYFGDFKDGIYRKYVMVIDAESGDVGIPGSVGIGTDKTQGQLDVAGTTRTNILQITGGSDLAEPFEIATPEAIEPGMVVAIDPDDIGQLRLADKAYDRTVAGVISGAGGINPGLTMQQEGTVAEDAYPVSLTGRVYVWADASSGPVQPGDLLTTSDTPGHAMRVTDYERAQGAILGKAMSALDEGQGLVLVLVTLQ